MRRGCLLILLIVALAGSVNADKQRITLATTTSTENSGLLSALLPPFEEKTGIRVDVVAVGTGAALKLGENGDADVILVHAPAAEQAFVDAGFGVNRRAVMHNDFVILGPGADPAKIKGMDSAADGLKELARSRSGGRSFVSRGDDSGTHKKELSLWQNAGVVPAGSWYKEVGQGMGAVLTLTSELEGYTMSDRGTFLSLADRIEIVVLVEGDPLLFNPYSIIAVNPALHAHIQYEDAMRLVAWVTSPDGQEIIRYFSRYGEALFHPDAVP